MSRLFQIARAPSRRRAPRGEPESFARRLDEALSDRRFRSLPADLEARFQSDAAVDQKRALHRAALATAVLYNVQLVAEWSLTPDALEMSAALHFGAVTPALLMIAAYARSADTPLSRDAMGVAIPLLIALQTAVTFCASAAAGAPYYLTMLAVIPILSNSSLPLSNRAANFSTTLCLTLLAVLTRTSSSAAKPLILGGMLPVCFCVIMTLISAVQRNRDARRAWLLDLRHRRRMAEMGQEARHDPLTRLANRRRLEEAAAKLWSDEASHVSPISVILYDVDRFKAFNDLYGHQAGDECLQRVAACALEEIGADDDVAARYGGEEFILVLPRTPLEEARRVAERLRAAVAALGITHAGGAELGVVTASFGVACADSAARSFAQLTAEADAALYSAKRTGRNRVVTAGVVASKEPKAA